jgi:hypothetical protein
MFAMQTALKHWTAAKIHCNKEAVFLVSEVTDVMRFPSSGKKTAFRTIKIKRLDCSRKSQVGLRQRTVFSAFVAGGSLCSAGSERSGLRDA